MKSKYYYCQSDGEVFYYSNRSAVNSCDECTIITKEEYEFLQNNEELFE